MQPWADEVHRELSKAGGSLGEGSSQAAKQFAQNLRATENEARSSTGRMSGEFGRFFDTLKEGFAFGGAGSHQRQRPIRSTQRRRLTLNQVRSGIAQR